MTLASALCTDCGLCCDGALFDSVSLDAAGWETARAHRLPVVDAVDGCRLELPCPALHGVLCEIYGARPTCCAEYACELRLRVDRGRLSLDDAREIVETTRAVRARVAATLGQKPWWRAHRSVLEAQRTHATWARDNADFVAALTALGDLIQRHFWGDSRVARSCPP